MVVPRSADESCGAIILHLELLRRAFFAVLALFIGRPRTPRLRLASRLRWVVVASASEAATALWLGVTVRFLGLMASADDFRELDFDDLLLFLLDGGTLKLLALFVRLLEALLV